MALSTQETVTKPFRTRCQRHYPCPQQCANLVRKYAGRCGPKGNFSLKEAVQQSALDTIERLSPAQHGRNKNALLKLPGERLMARGFDRQVAEMQIRAAILNRFTALRRPKTQRVE